MYDCKEFIVKENSNMIIRKHIHIILVLSVVFTLINQSNLTRAIFFDDYLADRRIYGVNYYLSLINESSKGNWALGSPYLKEWRFEPYLYPALNINAAGMVKRILGWDIKTYALAAGYLSVFAISFLLITAFLTLFNFNYFGYLAAAFYIFFPRWIEWNRTLSPEINFIPFALFFIAYFSRWTFWKRELTLGVLAGLLFYVYPYYWTFALALLAISDLLEFFRQRKIVWRHFYKYLVIAIFSSYYFLHLWQLHQLPYYQESIIRIGALYSRFPAGLYTQIFLLASLAVFLFFRNYFNHSFDKVVAGLLAGLVALNQQLVTGMQVEFNSHYLPTILLFLTAFWFGMALMLAKNFTRYKKFLAVLAILASFGAVANRIYDLRYSTGIEVYTAGRADAVVDWFLKNGIRDAVVYAPQDIIEDIILWTNNYLYFDPGQELQLMPTAELIDRFTYYDLTNNNITENLFQRHNMIFGMTFVERWQKDTVINKIKSWLLRREFKTAPLEDYVIYDFGEIYQKRINPDSAEFNKYLEKYQVDYLIYRQADRNSIYREAPGKIVFEDEEYLIKKRL